MHRLYRNREAALDFAIANWFKKSSRFTAIVDIRGSF
jgi:hypothetical protein